MGNAATPPRLRGVPLMLAPARAVVHRAAGLYRLERTLQGRGFTVVAGADEAGRGACAGPLVAAAVVLGPKRSGALSGALEELDDSKKLTPAARERVYAAVIAQARGYAVVAVPPGEIDSRGLHVCNLAAMRRALAALAVRPEYVLTDGFPVDGLGVPGLAVWKGDQIAACVAAASVVAKVTRDRMMARLHGDWPQYGFDNHKGYATAEHTAALKRHGPCPEHRFSYANVIAVAGPGPAGAALEGSAVVAVTRQVDRRGTVGVASGLTAEESARVSENVGMEGGPR